MCESSTINNNNNDNSICIKNTVDSNVPRIEPDLYYNSDNLAYNNNRRNWKIFKVCLVCGDKSSGRHYRINTCEGCRCFFKRSFLHPTFYICKANRNCNITKKTRKQCRYCRLQKCFHMGMEANASGLLQLKKNALLDPSLTVFNKKNDNIAQNNKLKLILSLDKKRITRDAHLNKLPTSKRVLPTTSVDNETIEQGKKNLAPVKDNTTAEMEEKQTTFNLNSLFNCSKKNLPSSLPFPISSSSSFPTANNSNLLDTLTLTKNGFYVSSKIIN